MAKIAQIELMPTQHLHKLFKNVFIMFSITVKWLYVLDLFSYDHIYIINSYLDLIY